MKKVRKQSVLRKARENGVWQGYLAPSNINGYNIKGNWYIGTPVMIVYTRDNHYNIVNVNGSWNLELWLAKYSYYNCNSEVGNHVRYWEE